MYRDDDGLVVSASDLVGYLECGHLTTLSLEATTGSRSRPMTDDPGLEVLRRRGLEHEAEYLAQLQADGLRVVEIEGFPEGRAGLRAAAAATSAALAAGTDVVFQGTFFDERDAIAWRGHADFLTRVGVGTDGPARYEPEDTKLAGRVKPSAVLQLCSYAEQLTAVQGSEPELIHVVLRGQRRETVRLATVASYFRAARGRFLEAVGASRDDSYPDPVSHCVVCSWNERCADQRRSDDHLILVAGIGRDQIRKLEKVGVTTTTELAVREPLVVPGIGAGPLEAMRAQARLQVQHRDNPTLPLPYEILNPSGVDRGLEGLPEPCPGDLYFDIEGDPFVGDTGLEYLFGIGWMDDDAQFDFRAFWAHDPAAEKVAFEQLIDLIGERRAARPTLHVYHYAAYEQTALGTLMGRHGTRELEVDGLFREHVLIDLYKVVHQGIRVGSESYSLKKLEPLYMETRTDAIVDAGSSIAEYERWLEKQDQQILDDIEAYNRVDCESTWRLHGWLESRRREAESNGAVLARRAAPVEAAELEETTEPEPLETELAVLAEKLRAGVVAAPGDDLTPEAAARNLLANLLEWHRREDKPAWWRFFARIDGYEPGDLVDDTECIGGLEYVGEVGTIKQSILHQYRFDPDQEHKIRLDSTVLDPMSERRKVAGEIETASSPGVLFEIDAGEGTLVLKRSKRSEVPHPTALMPSEIVQSKPLKEAIRRIAEWVVAHGIDGPGEFRGARDLLLLVPPRIEGSASGVALRRAGEETLDAAVRLISGLDDSYLAIQGPPGAGKTFTAAHAIVDLVQCGRVGITANTHQVVTNLLTKVMEAADDAGIPVRAIQKTDGLGCVHDNVVVTDDNGKVESAVANGEVDLVAGTPWLFAREGLVGTLTHLIIDEAGQLSLANVVAAAGAARNLVLVGDPQQLAQPSKGTHPPGAGASGLEHILQGRPTLEDDRGLFLDTTWRMHPDVCSYISVLAYEGRLGSRPECATQRIGGVGPLSGSGLRWVPVDHEDNRLSSAEEAVRVAEIYGSLLEREWTDQHGTKARIGPEDVLVVAPYNAQVHRLTEHLPGGALIGTVDKFQGKEAAVVIVSLAASSAEDIPRGLEFLFSTNRLNVAVSRARALAVVVASPALLAVHCRTVKQMQLVNGLCRFAEQAEPA